MLIEGVAMTRTVKFLRVLTLLCAMHSEVFAQSPRIEFQPVLANSVTAPLYLTTANDGSGRLFIVEEGGRIMVSAGIGKPATVFLDLTSKVLSGGERGFLGLVFHPNFAQNRRFFVDYTRRADGTIVIAEYKASATNSNVAEPV